MLTIISSTASVFCTALSRDVFKFVKIYKIWSIHTAVCLCAVPMLLAVAMVKSIKAVDAVSAPLFGDTTGSIHIPVYFDIIQYTSVFFSIPLCNPFFL